MKILQVISEIITRLTDSTGRTQRQFLVLDRWARRLFHGTFVACTGFGKTRVGTEALKLLRRSDKNRKVIVVVPTIALRDQWQGILKDIKQEENTEVWVVNSLSAETMTHYCSLLICDEIHRYAAESFKRIFNVVKYEYILGLTATIERADGKHKLLEKYAPVFDDVPLHVARAKGWVAEYDIYNYGISLSEEDQQEYDVLYGKQSKLNKYMATFDFDFQKIIKCSFSNKPRYAPEFRRWFDPDAVGVARRMGWEGNNAFQAGRIMQSNKTAPRGQKQNVWGGDIKHIYHPDRIVGYAVQARKIVAARQNYIANHPLKTEAVIDIYNQLKMKTISFAQTKDVAILLQETIGEKAVSYYSGMSPQPVMVQQQKVYKREISRQKFIAKNPDIEFELRDEGGNFIVLWKKQKFIGEAELKREALRKISDNRYKIDFISSVKALNEGIDIPDLQLALIHSRDSTARNAIQRIGRVARLFIYKDGSNKKPIIVNIYLKNTKDEDWLKASMRGIIGAIWIEDITLIGATNNEFVLV